MNPPLPIYRCRDDMAKICRLVFDSGSDGHYAVELCKECRQKQNKKFLISEQGLDPTTVEGGTKD